MTSNINKYFLFVMWRLITSSLTRQCVCMALNAVNTLSTFDVYINFSGFSGS